jgi:phosphoribosylglycinamide formyltransferase-1
MKASGIKATAETKKRLAKVLAIGTSLPEAKAVVQGYKDEHRALQVRKKTFAYYCFDHHGDGEVALWLKATPGEQGRLVEDAPKRFFVPPYLGPRGWVALRLDGKKVDWAELAYLLTSAYRLTAPRALAARLE